MEDKIKKLKEPLSKDDVEIRIGNVNAKGFSLLLYKTSRTDVNRLNEVFGSKWKNKHFYDTKGLLCCKISVYDTDIKEWVDREDVGIESYTEKEKGSYSDSFKRAGFRWGIGLELYKSPFIWVSWRTEKTKTGAYKPIGFYPSNVEITRYEVENSRVKVELKYKTTNAILFSSFGNSNFDPYKNITNEKITKEQEEELREVIEDNKLKPSVVKNILRSNGAEMLKDISSKNYKKMLSTFKSIKTGG